MKEQNKSNNNYYNKVFDNLYNLLSNPEVNINKNTQFDIEQLLNNLCTSINTAKVSKDKSLGISMENISKSLQDLLVDTNIDLKRSIKKYKLYLNNSTKTNDTLEYEKEIYEVFNTIKTDYIISIVLTHYLRWVCFHDTNESNHQYLVNVSTRLGTNIFDVYLYHKYVSYNKENNTNLTLSEWKELNVDICNIYNNKYNKQLDCEFGNRVINMLVTIHIMSVKNIKIKNRLHNVIVIPERISKQFRKSNIFIPLKLPMIVKPKEYKSEIKDLKITEVLGGYLSNDITTTDKLVIPKAGYKTSSTIYKSELYKAINDMSSVPYKINTEVFEFIANKGLKYGLVCDINLIEKIKNDHYNKNKWSSTYYERKYKSEMSKYVLEVNILNIANIYKNLYQIYFPVRIDNRGRVYCVPNYLNYQGNDLAKSLLLFSNESIIHRDNKEAIDFFYIYGANCYGNGVDKKSYEKRISWVENNTDRIYNFEDSGILEEAKNRHLFLVFCFEFKRYYNFIKDFSLNEFRTSLPIQLDASCNGFQHLSLLSQETKLYELLNLNTSDYNKQPKDFYNYIILRLTETLKSKMSDMSDKKHENFSRLYEFFWERSDIKNLIMTIPYNLTKYSARQYVRDTLSKYTTEYEDLGPNGAKMTWFIKGNNKINGIDVVILVDIIMDIINIDFENIRRLRDYLKAVADIHNTLNLPITWNSGNGLLVTQSYLKWETVKIKPFSYSKTRLNFTRSNPGEFDKKKQSDSMMPNIIHTLDALALMLLFMSFTEEYKNNYCLYAIHDCFATTADKMSTLISLLKSAYIKIYSDEPYLRTFDKNIIEYILNVYGSDIEWIADKRTFIYDNCEYKVPSIDWVLNKQIPTLNNPYLIT